MEKGMQKSNVEGIANRNRWRGGTVYDPDVVRRASIIGKAREAQSSHMQAVAIARATKKAKRYLRGSTATNLEVPV
jgi:hypothetical protein